MRCAVKKTESVGNCLFLAPAAVGDLGLGKKGGKVRKLPLKCFMVAKGQGTGGGEEENWVKGS